MSQTFSDVNKPSLSDYIIFMRNQGIRADYLPDASQWLLICYNAALAKANQDFQNAGVPSIYTLAVYNFALHLQIEITPDQDNQTFFEAQRTAAGMFKFVPGVIASAGDQGTSGAVLNSEALKNLTLGDLQMLKTPYGRSYLAFAQDYGPTIWGLS